MDQSRDLFCLLGDVYVTVEGGPGLSKDIRVVAARGAAVVPIIRTGEASSGRFGFPAHVIERPHFASEEQWALLRRKDRPLADCARAVVDLVNRAIGNQPLESRVDKKAACEGNGDAIRGSAAREIGAAQEVTSTSASIPSLNASPTLGTLEEFQRARQTPVLGGGAAVETPPLSDGRCCQASEPVTCATPDLAMAAPRGFGTPPLAVLNPHTAAKCDIVDDKSAQLRLREEFAARVAALAAQVEQVQAAELADRCASRMKPRRKAVVLRHSISMVTGPPSDRSIPSD